jgi:hypothetical protein
VFHNFLCKYSDKDLPDNFEKIGLIIDEYKKIKEDTSLDSIKVNIKNKPILVKGDKPLHPSATGRKRILKYYGYNKLL